MNILEQLGKDSEGRVSSQPPIKSGKDRGYRKAEIGGKWICAGGFCYESRQESKSPHYSWSETVQQFGILVGVWDYEGVKEFYLFMKGNDE
jgi:hypothetical protein